MHFGARAFRAGAFGNRSLIMPERRVFVIGDDLIPDLDVFRIRRAEIVGRRLIRHQCADLANMTCHLAMSGFLPPFRGGDAGFVFGFYRSDRGQRLAQPRAFRLDFGGAVILPDNRLEPAPQVPHLAFDFGNRPVQTGQRNRHLVASLGKGLSRGLGLIVFPGPSAPFISPA